MASLCHFQSLIDSRLPEVLREINFVPLRPFVTEEVRATRVTAGLDAQGAQKVAQTIAKYATPADKVEPTRMIEFFRSRISQEWLMQHREDMLKQLGWWFLDAPPRSHMHPNAHPLKMGAERKLVAFIACFFMYRMQEDLLRVPPEFRFSIHNHILASEAIVSCENRIVGLTRVDEEIVNATEDCQWYVFRHHPWFFQAKGWLLTHLETALKVLIDRGYTIAARAAPGQVAVYHTMTQVVHYGRVESADPSGEITVRSKWSYSQVYRHRAGIIGAAYGYRILFLNPP